MNTERYPLDIDAIEKGSTVTVEEMERIFQIPRTDARFSLRTMGLKEFIQRGMLERGQVVTVAIRRGALCVLRDEEASIYNDREARNKRLGMLRDLARLQGVDVSNIPEERRPMHERRVAVLGRYVEALRETAKVIRSEGALPYRAPKMIEKSEG